MTKETKNNDGDLGQIEPPRYVCHKKVWALKIHSVIYPAIPAGSVILKFFDVMFVNREMPPGFNGKARSETWRLLSAVRGRLRVLLA